MDRIELIVDEWEGYQFIGLNKEEIVGENFIDITMPKKTVQTKLM